MRVDASVHAHVIDLAIQIQQIPAATFYESNRADFILQCWKNEGLADTQVDKVGNVYACMHGKEKKPGIVVSAHLDTVFPLDTPLAIRREKEHIYGPGIGDNSLGLAGLFGISWCLSQMERQQGNTPLLQRDIWLVANVGEEGLGDLSGMKAVVDHFGEMPAAYIVLEGMSLGQIYHRGLGVRRYKITVKTPGGHSWLDYGNPSAIHLIAELIVKIKNIKVPVDPRTSLNIGIISGGTSVNTIASEASCELDLRSENPEGLKFVVDQVLALVEEANQLGGENVQVQTERIGDRPTGEIPLHHPLVKIAVKCHEKNGIETKFNIGSTDANVPLSRGLPAICVGLTTGGGAHTREEYIDIQPLSQGLSTVVDILLAVDKNI